MSFIPFHVECFKISFCLVSKFYPIKMRFLLKKKRPNESQQGIDGKRLRAHYKA